MIGGSHIHLSRSLSFAYSDPVFKVSRLYNECQDPKKVSLGIGAYRDNNGNPLVLQAVIKAKAELAAQDPQKWTHEYLPIHGYVSTIMVVSINQ